MCEAPGVRNSNATLLPEINNELRPSGFAASCIVFHAIDELLVVRFAAIDAIVPTTRLPNVCAAHIVTENSK